RLELRADFGAAPRTDRVSPGGASWGGEPSDAAGRLLGAEEAALCVPRLELGANLRWQRGIRAQLRLHIGIGRSGIERVHAHAMGCGLLVGSAGEIIKSGLGGAVQRARRTRIAHITG